MRQFCQRICLIFVASLPLGACGSSGGLSKVDVDPELTTSSLAKSIEDDATQNSDANILRNAVSAVNLDAPVSVPLNWANRDTGSSGTINTITESNADGAVCRKFETSRESFEGVSLYNGNACLGADGQWFMQEFVAF